MYLIIILLILCIIGIFIYIWYEFQSKLKLHINLKNPKLSKDLKLIKKFLKTKDGIRIASWYIPVLNPKAVLILVDGYKEQEQDKVRMFNHAEYLKKAGYSCILIDLRSFGESDGDKVTFGVNEWKDVETAYDYVKKLPENKDKKIGFLGISMGGAISIVAKGITGKGDFIVALTPYANFKSLFDFRIRKRRLPSFLFLPILQVLAFFELGFNYAYYTATNMVKKVNVPIFIVSAKHDHIVNSHDAKYIYDRANSPKEYWQTNTSHRVFKDNPRQLQKKILNFLSKHI